MKKKALKRAAETVSLQIKYQIFGLCSDRTVDRLGFLTSRTWNSNTVVLA